MFPKSSKDASLASAEDTARRTGEAGNPPQPFPRFARNSDLGYSTAHGGTPPRKDQSMPHGLPLSPLSRFRDIHRGERIFIVCNGPSLNAMDLTPLRGQIVFGLNKIFLGLDRFGFYPRYMAVVNDKVVAQEARALRAMTSVKFVTDRAAHILPQGSLTYHMRTTQIPDPFCHDIARSVREGHTVTFVALQIAHYMGAAEVVIVGMDHRYAQSGPPNAELTMTGPDPNHFSDAYFGYQKWDAPNLAQSEASYRIAREVYAAGGRRIIDATVDGACDIFEKASLDDLFRGRSRRIPKSTANA